MIRSWDARMGPVEIFTYHFIIPSSYHRLACFAVDLRFSI